MRLSLRSGPNVDERTLSGSSCETLFETAWFSYTLMVERAKEQSAAALDDGSAVGEVTEAPEALLPAPTGDNNDAQSMASETQAPVDSEFASSPSRSIFAANDAPALPPVKERVLVWGPRILAGAGLGPTGLPSTMLGGTLGLGRSNWRFELGGTVYLPRRVLLDGADVGARISAWSLGAEGCWVGRWAKRWSSPVCAQAQAGRVRAQGIGVASPRSVRRPLVHVGTRLGVGWLAHPRVRLSLAAVANVSLFPASFVVDGASGELFRAPRVNLFPELSVEFRFGEGRKR